MPAAHSLELRWLVIYKRVMLNQPPSKVSQDLCGVSEHFQRDMLQLFTLTGDVRGLAYAAGRERKARSRRSTKMTAALDLELIGRVLDDPKAILSDHAAHGPPPTGRQVERQHSKRSDLI